MQLWPYLVDECAAVHAGDLAFPHVRALEVGVQQQCEAEGVLRAQRVVDADVEVQLLLTQDQPVGQSEPEPRIAES